jgi:hypothetical protein
MVLREDHLEIDERFEAMVGGHSRYREFQRALETAMPEEWDAVRQALDEKRIGGLHAALAYTHPLALRAVAAFCPTLPAADDQNEAWESAVREKLLAAIADAVRSSDALSPPDKALMNQLAPGRDLALVRKALDRQAITTAQLEDVLDRCGTGYQWLLDELTRLDLEEQYK